MKMKSWSMRVVACCAFGAVFPLLGGCEKITEVEKIKDLCDSFTCGKFSEGELTISGNAQIDGLFKALQSAQIATTTIRGNFEKDVIAIGEAFGVATPANRAVDKAYIASVKAAVDAEFESKLVGGKPHIVYEPPRCEANLDVGIRASAECKVQGGCKVDVDCKGGELLMKCEGKCSGRCTAGCTVPVCRVDLDLAGKCSAECHGGCEVVVDGSCEGTCRGACTGECAYSEGGQCAGKCTGTCKGKCETKVAANCTGVCRGQCELRGEAAANCTGKASCEGECSGECSGGCEGKISAPHCSVDATCDAEAKCNAQASMQASANLECRPPVLEMRFVFKAGVDAKGQAEFYAKKLVLDARLASMDQGRAKLTLLIKGEGTTPGVLAQIGTEFTSVLGGIVSGEIKINPVRLPCVKPAVEEAASMVKSISSSVDLTLEGQLIMKGIIDGNKG